MKKKKHLLDWKLIKILAKENNDLKRRLKELFVITNQRYKSPLLNKKNEYPTISTIRETDLIFLLKFLAQGKEVS